MKKSVREWTIAAVIVGVVAMAMTAPAFAGTGGTEFSDIYDLLTGWSKGTLGKVMAVGMFLVGIGTGIVRQSITARLWPAIR